MMTPYASDAANHYILKQGSHHNQGALVSGPNPSPPSLSSPQYASAPKVQHPNHSNLSAPSPVQSVLHPSAPSPRRSRTDPYYHMSPNAQQTSQATNSPHPTTLSYPSPQLPNSPHSHSSIPSGDRYPCDLCDRTFTRSHDRRRHYETVHSTTPVLHKCRFCQKDFSRADSLKRHQDNGCDERPSNR